MIKYIRLYLLTLTAIGYGFNTQGQRIPNLTVTADPVAIQCGGSSTLEVQIETNADVYRFERTFVTLRTEDDPATPTTETSYCEEGKDNYYYARINDLYYLLTGYNPVNPDNVFTVNTDGVPSSSITFSGTDTCDDMEFEDSMRNKGDTGNDVELDFGFTTGDFNYTWSNGLPSGTIQNVSPLESTTYIVSASPKPGINADGVSKAITVNVINSPIVPEITTDDDFLCTNDGSSSTIIRSVGSYSNYFWELDGDPLSEWSGSRTITATLPGRYVLRVIVGSGCESQPSEPLDIYVHDGPSPDFQVFASPTTVSCGNTSTLTVLTNMTLPVYLVERESVTLVEKNDPPDPVTPELVCTIQTDREYYALLNGSYYLLTGYDPTDPDGDFTMSETGISPGQITSRTTDECDGVTYNLYTRIVGPTGEDVSTGTGIDADDFDFYWSNGLGTGTTKIVSPDVSTTYTVIAKPKNGVDASCATAEITVNVVAVQPVIEANTYALCADDGTSSVSISSIQEFSNYYWMYNGAPLPEWDGYRTIVVSEHGEYVLQGEVSGGCPTVNSESLQISLYDLGVGISMVKSCGGAELTATPTGDPRPYNMLLEWFKDGAPFRSGENLTPITVTESGLYYVEYSIYDEGNCTPDCFTCLQASNQILVDIEFPVAVDAGPDDQSCDLSYELNAQPLTNATGTWTLLEGPGTAVFANANAYNSLVSVSKNGTYTLQWATTGDLCPGSSDEVVIDFLDVGFDIFIENTCPSLSDPVVLNIESNNTELVFTIDWGDGTTSTTSDRWIDHIYAEQGQYQITITTNAGPCTYALESEIILISLCATAVAEDGQFKLDKLTGTIYFDRPDCQADIAYNCLIGPSESIPKVITAEALEFSDKWRHTRTDVEKSTPDNPLRRPTIYERGERGHWRVSSTNTFKTDLKKDISGTDKNYKYGTYDLKTFSWDNPKVNSRKWIRSSRILAYSPNGDALIEENALKIRSAVKFGYRDALPMATAANVHDLSTMYFESFENTYGDDENILEDFGNTGVGAVVSSNYHGGKQSLQLTAGESWQLRDLKLSNQVFSEGLIFKFWAKSTGDIETVDLAIEDATTSSIISTKPLNVTSQVGDWYLLEVYLEPADFNPLAIGDDLSFFIQNGSAANLWIDDVKFQPTHAQMTCYVYDDLNLRLMAVYDDMHFGLYYHYNGEGQLVRKMIETERGIKTIQETFYNISGELE